MKKTLIEVNYDKLDENSVIVFKNDNWIAIPKSAFLDSVYKELQRLEERINELHRLRLEDGQVTMDALNNHESRIKVLEGEEDNEEEQ